MYIVAALLIVLLLAWLLGIGQFVNFNANLHLGGGLETLVLVIVIVVLVMMVVRRV